MLKEMAKSHVMVEITLTSNDVILGISGKNHPLPDLPQTRCPGLALHRRRRRLPHRPDARICPRRRNLRLRYADLKQMVRTGMEHSFLPGDSLWPDPDTFKRPVAACSAESLGAEKPTAACDAFLKASEKAQQQWELERRFRAFESSN